MAYTPTVWENDPSTDTPIDATNLNHLETGVDDAHAAIDAHLVDTTNVHGIADTAIIAATTAVYTSAKDTKLSGIATGATANSADATLLARGNHTGTQAQSTIVNLVTDLAAKETPAGAQAKATAAALGIFIIQDENTTIWPSASMSSTFQVWVGTVPGGDPPAAGGRPGRIAGDLVALLPSA